MTKPKLLNVRKNLEHTVWLMNFLLDEHKAARSGGTVLAPIFINALKEHRFFTGAILRKHTAKQTRKDIYVERS